MDEANGQSEANLYYEKNPVGSGWIRVLCLLSGRPESDLVGHLEIIPFPAASDGSDARRPPYEALSYYWGEKHSDNVQSIKIVQTDHVFSITLRDSLASALRHLRYPDRTRRLWIDRLSINQKSHEEKNVQLPQIHRIYYEALQVCVWLGPTDERSACAMRLVQQCLKLGDFEECLHIGDAGAEKLVCFAELLQRPWFNR